MYKVAYSAVSTLTLVICVFLHGHGCDAEDVIFYDDDGSQFTLTITGGCYLFKEKWNKRSTEILIKDGCFNFWSERDCKGRNLTLSQGMHDLYKLKFEKIIQSAELCSPEEEERMRLLQGPSPKSTPAPALGPGEKNMSLSELQQLGVEEHNKYRRKHGVPDLHGDPVMHGDAQKWAEYLTANNKFEATTMGKYGTNIATSIRFTKMEAIRDSIRRWYDKNKFYDYNKPGFDNRTGSFTAIVWKTTVNLGIGISWSDPEEHWVIVAFYDPPAKKSQFRENVPPPKN